MKIFKLVFNYRMENIMIIKIKRILHKVCPVAMTKYYYKKILGRKLNLRNPQTLNEKVNWLKLYYWPKNPISSIVADKYSVREYVKEKGYENILNPLIGAWDNVDDIPWDDLPDKFAIKCGHGCGMNIVCFDKNNFNVKEAKEKLSKWMKIDWGKDSCEPHYSKIKPMIICEKFIGEGKSLPDDIKIHCFHGEPKLIAYYSGRGSCLHGTFYDLNWKHLCIATKEGVRVEKPVCLAEILDICRGLTQNLPYARMDFYVSNGKPIFGEITLTPASGRSPYMTREADLYYGSMLDLSVCGFKRCIF